MASDDKWSGLGTGVNIPLNTNPEIMYGKLCHSYCASFCKWRSVKQFVTGPAKISHVSSQNLTTFQTFITHNFLLLSPLCHLLAYLEPVGLSTMCKSFIRSCLKYGHFFILVLLKVIWTIWMLFSVKLLVFVITLFHLYSHTGMQQQLDSHIL